MSPKEALLTDQGSLYWIPRKPLLDTKEALLTDQGRLTDRPIKLRTMFGVIQTEVYRGGWRSLFV